MRSKGRRRVADVVSSCMAALILLVGLVSPLGGVAHADTDTVDELHYSYGDDATSVVVDWHGAEQNLYYGPTTDYGMQVTANDPPILPTDEPGPFREIKIAGLQAGATYHYKVGTAGLDHTFSTEPTGDFTSVDVGDTMSSACANPDTTQYMPRMQQLIAQQNPNFVTHGGDIAIANQCGIGAIHAFFNDVEQWSGSAAFQTALGNHEYGAPTTDPPAAADAPKPNDNLANYKGRLRISNAQTVPTDSSGKLTHPGCPAVPGTTSNGCIGDDWGYFTAGHVFYLEYPEPETTNPDDYVNWTPHADTLMAQAQADPNIDFIITYGHRPPKTDSVEGPQTDLFNDLDSLAAKYSPYPGNLNGTNGKYVMNIGHHAHGFEPFKPAADTHGLTYVTDAAGGQGFTPEISGPTDPDSLMYKRHFGFLVTQYTAATHTMDVKFVCGADSAGQKDTCPEGTSPWWSTRFVSPNTSTPPPVNSVLQTTVSGAGSAQIGQQVTYTVTAQNTAANSTAAGVNMTVNVPTNMSIVSALGATITGGTASWSLGDLAGGSAAVSKTVTAQLNSGNVGDTATVTAQLNATDTSCTNTGSNCSASTPTTITASQTTVTTQWIGNQSFDTDLTGWTGVYSTTSGNSRVAGGPDGTGYSLRSVNTGSATGAIGFIDKDPTKNAAWWINGTTGKSTVAGTQYTGSVAVKADVSGEKFNVFLRELNAAGTTVGSKTIPVTSASAGWLPPISGTYTALNSGDSLRFYVYVTNAAPGQGFNADNLSLTSTTIVTTTPPADTTAPAWQPSDVLNVTVTGQSTTTLNWPAATDAVGVTGYSIWRDNSPAPIATIPGITFSDSGLAAGTTHTYTVKALDAAGNASLPLTATATTAPTLNAPTLQTTAPPTVSEVDLGWNTPAGATSYSVQRDDGTGSMTIASGLTTPGYADKNVVASKTYNYSVTVFDAYNDTAVSVLLQVSTPAPVVVPLSAPVLSVVAKASQNELSWTASTGTYPVASYTVVKDGVNLPSLPATTLNYVDTSVTAGTSHTYVVFATDSNNAPSPNSNAVIPTTPVVPTVTQWVANASLETDLTGWTGVYNTTSKSTRVTGGFDGAYAIRSINTATAIGANGFIDKPHWLDGTTGKATTAGTIYTASVYVKADVAQQKLYLLIRELTPSGTAVSSKTQTVTAGDNSSWNPLSLQYTAQASGNVLGFYVYSSNSPAGQGFIADALSLTSNN